MVKRFLEKPEMLIGELSRLSGLSRDTIRYYEKRGLLTAVGRRDNAYKDYPEHSAERLRFVRSLQSRGFTLNEIRALLLRNRHNPATCGEVAELIRVKAEAIDAQIKALQDRKQRLHAGFECCSGKLADTCRPVAAEILK